MLLVALGVCLTGGLMSVESEPFDFKHYMALALVKARQSHKWAWLTSGYKHASDWTRALRGDIPLDLRRIVKLGPEVWITFSLLVLEEMLQQQAKESRDAFPRPRMAKVDLDRDPDSRSGVDRPGVVRDGRRSA